MNVTTVPLLEDLQGIWRGLRVELFGGPADPMPIRDMYPFSSVTDLKRQIWIQMEGDPRWAPERVFLAVRQSDGNLRPLEFHWSAAIGTVLPDPLPSAARVPSTALIDEAGNRKPVPPPTMLGSLILEAALAPEMRRAAPAAPPPTLTAVPLIALRPDTEAQLTAPLFSGFYQLYFPWLTEPAQVITADADTQSIRDAWAATVPYMYDRTGRVEMVQSSLARGRGGDRVTMNTMVRLRWVMPPPSKKPESLERTFYSLRATADLPFLRYFPPAGKGAPILKLGLKGDGSVILDDPRVMTQYLSQPPPVTTASVIVGRIPLRSTHAERGAAFTLYMFEDGSTDITLEVPHRGLTYIAPVATDALRALGKVIRDMGFPEGTEPTLRDLHATYNWTHPDPERSIPISTARLQSRVAALTPFFDTVPAVASESKALGVFAWRATSNYESESAQFAFITQMALRDKEEEDPMETRARYQEELKQKFGLTTEEADTVMERWFERRTAAVVPVPGVGAGTLAVPKHSTGVQVSVSGAHPEYRVEVQGVDSYQELQRVLSVVGVLLGAPKEELRIAPPSSAVATVGQHVALEEAKVEDAVEGQAGATPPLEEGDVEGGEMDPALAALLADLGYGGDDLEGLAEGEGGAPEQSEATAAAAPPPPAEAAAFLPDLNAAAAEASGECTGVRWSSSEPPLSVIPEYYIAKLKAADSTYFHYKFPKGSLGSQKTYARSCARPDGRQPDIMSLAEYARVKRCYEGRVRFVDLPPRKPSDLPTIPGYSPKKKIPDEAFEVDSVTGLPIWSVYGYENKTTPGQFRYLMCAELWCDRDNMPLLRPEFEGTVGRDGQPKPPNTCPFCAGAVIEDLKSPESGQSVIVRIRKGATGKLHGFIGEMGREVRHPQGWRLPCCDTTPRLIKEYMEEAFYGRLTFAGAAAEGGEEDEFAEAAPELDLAPVPAPGEEQRTDYRAVLDNMPTQYVLAPDKTLERGKIGLLPAYLDAFFGQNGRRAIVTKGIRPTLVAGATVFVRIGVDSRVRQPGLNLFAALAPLLGFESAEQTQRHFLTQRMVRAFESANYGTLVQEFAAKSTVTDAEITSSLQTFATEFGYTLGPSRAHVTRLYKAWIAFLEYLNDQKKPKRLSHIEHLMAQPGVILPRGLLVVALEKEGDSIRVVCPSFGIPSASYFGDVPVAFLWRDKQVDLWEPIILYNGTRQAVTMFGERSAALEVLPPDQRVSIQRWLREWRTSSLGCGRPAPPPHVWTPDRDTSGLPRLSTLLNRVKGYRVTALVRDRSNRLAGVLMTGPQATGTAASMGAGAAPTLFLPCLDDGALAISVPRVYEAEGIPPAPLETYLRFYTSEEIARSFPVLRPEKLLSRGAQIIGFQTAAGVMIPTAPTATPPAGFELPVQQVDMFPWERDALILRAPDAVAGATAAIEESTASVEEQMAEAYQHLRVTMARWLKQNPAATPFKANLAALLKSKYPLYERRKRMDILIEPVIRGWITPEQTEVRRLLPLLREDCLALPGEEECRASGACRWSGGRCLIHAPFRREGTDPVRIFTARLSDELLRYSTQRRELFDDAVPMIRTPRGVIRQENELYIATKPKETATSVLERLGFLTQIAESFPEEMLKFEGLEEPAAPLAGEEGEEGEEAGAETAAATSSQISEALPPSWTAMNMFVPTPALDLPDARYLAWAAGTGISIEKWANYLTKRRKVLGVPGEESRPFQWSIQDFFVLSSMIHSNILFVRQAQDGRLVLDHWIAPPGPQKTDQPLYTILWGPRQLLVTKGFTTQYNFYARDLPEDLRALLDTRRPMPEAEARGYLASAFAEPEAAETPTDTEESEEQAEAPAAETTMPGGIPPQPAATQEGEGGLVPAPQPAPGLS
jgi:hypothetical protein